MLGVCFRFRKAFPLVLRQIESIAKAKDLLRGKSEIILDNSNLDRRRSSNNKNSNNNNNNKIQKLIFGGGGGSGRGDSAEDNDVEELEAKLK